MGDLRYSYKIQGMDWETFKRLFREAYFNANHCRAITDDFEDLDQGDMIVTELLAKIEYPKGG